VRGEADPAAHRLNGGVRTVAIPPVQKRPAPAGPARVRLSLPWTARAGILRTPAGAPSDSGSPAALPVSRRGTWPTSPGGRSSAALDRRVLLPRHSGGILRGGCSRDCRRRKPSGRRKGQPTGRPLTALTRAALSGCRTTFLDAAVKLLRRSDPPPKCRPRPAGHSIANPPRSSGKSPRALPRFCLHPRSSRPIIPSSETDLEMDPVAPRQIDSRRLGGCARVAHQRNAGTRDGESVNSRTPSTSAPRYEGSPLRNRRVRVPYRRCWNLHLNSTGPAPSRRRAADGRGPVRHSCGLVRSWQADVGRCG
jgi:hypothetical protein